MYINFAGELVAICGKNSISESFMITEKNISDFLSILEEKRKELLKRIGQDIQNTKTFIRIKSVGAKEYILDALFDVNQEFSRGTLLEKFI